MKTVQEICRAFRITRKTLFYYDRIDLLEPTVRSGKQKAKEYDEKAVVRLQKIQNYRRAGMRLEEIRLILEDPEREEEILNEVIRRMKEEIMVLQTYTAEAEYLLKEAAGRKEKENDE